MDRLNLLFNDHGATILLMVLSVIALIRLIRRGGPILARSPVTLGTLVAIFSLIIGKFTLTTYLGLWTAITSMSMLTIALVGMVMIHRWSPWIGRVLAVVTIIGVGGWAMPTAEAGVRGGLRMLRSLEVVHPWWLLLLGILPWMVWISRRSLAGLGPIRSKLAIGARLLVTTLLIFAVAELRLSRPTEHTTVLYLIDRSLSVPQEITPNQATAGGEPIDQRWTRVQQFLNEAVQKRGLAHRNDPSGVVLFARRPRLVLPPSPVDRLFVSDQMAGPIDANYTDIASALKLALASFPEGTGKRVVLISDGNENLGNAEEQA